MDLSSYILAGLAELPKVNVTIGAYTVAAIFNQSTHRDSKTFGGYEPDNEAVLTIATSLLTNPKTLKGTTCILDGETWRIISVRYGVTVCHLTINSADKA